MRPIPSRDLAWEGCINVRDLGGHPTEDGGETRFGRVVRADSVRQLSDAGWKALVDYGIGRIVDLRWHEELEADPPRELPVDVVHVPLLEPQSEMREVEALAARFEDPIEHKQTSYSECLRRFRQNFGAAIEAVAEPADGAVLVHCAGGVDRTGLVTALLLRLGGVRVDTVGADYAFSEQNWAPYSDEWIAAGETHAERRWRRIWSAVPAQVMVNVLTELEREHGSIRAYLRESGVSEVSLDRVTARLRG